ncbi:Hsp70 family protein [Azohydromonas caseinilytica]|uniref:Hsp70 family protein n=1 Tax=Azohydromonas caseinilytica TaxID=2728836 RepID=A0A848F5M8_9BURK|nr:Hsp70 family protein [Azohydromonas caseinilytica]NML13600.1 hsp70 family protein [Azohydromonas caseinilytica]
MRKSGAAASPCLVGIDLGTTHTVVAWAEPGATEIRLFEVDQLIGPGEIGRPPLLPSLRYHPAPGELPPQALQLPWPSDEPAVIGALARRLGAQVPGRLVASAKSWLSHAAVDRLAPILPWGAEAEVPKVSPLQASASTLAHVRASWNTRFPDRPLERQDIVLTVPASFDDSARQLTVEAAREAGLPQLKLLEEPQAAFQDWAFKHRADLAAALGGARLVLVCDVGGGTTDLSLIRVAEGGRKLDRIAVGQHLMLGGDNVDLALAHVAERRLGGERLSAGRLTQLVERCRVAKETLLAANAPDSANVTLLGGGSKLIGGSKTVTFTREEVHALALDGFFPHVAPDEPVKRSRAGLVEFGLPYAADSAVTRHIAAFLRQHAAVARQALGSDAAFPVPDALLLNGGVFKAEAIVRRLLEVLSAWRGGPVTLLANADPDLAVARGAVAHGLARRGAAPKLGGGSARDYWLKLDEHRAVCVLPRGTEPGVELPLAERRFALRVGQPVNFTLLSSVGGALPAPGALTNPAEGEFTPLPPVSTVVQVADQRRELPVQLSASLTEVGTLALQATDEAGQRHALEFRLRGLGASGTSDAGLHPRLNEALERIDRVFGPRAKDVTPKEVRQLRTALEQLLGARERWSLLLLRRLFDALLQRARGRRRSADHERLWLNLAGWCLRPGFGFAADDWRVQQLFASYDAGVQHRADAQVMAEWWTLWRRVAGGLDEAAQGRLLQDFAFNLQGEGERPPGLVPGGREDMLRLVAALERIPAEHKAEIGDWLLGQLPGAVAAAGGAKPARGKGGKAVAKGASPAALELWTLGRLGARAPLYGSAHTVVAPAAAARWIDALLALDWRAVPAAPLAAVHLARRTGDRSRDIDEALRARLLQRLEEAGAAAHWIGLVREVRALDEADEQQAFGEALPPGLRLLA